MSKARVEVDAYALHAVLSALNGAPHLIRELQCTRDNPPLFVGNPIDKLIRELNSFLQQEVVEGQDMSDTDFKKEPICPYCGHEENDAWEINFGGIDGETEHDCGKCGETYVVQRNAIITHSTTKKETK